MSYGHSQAPVTVMTPHGHLTAFALVAWVRCDLCGATRTVAAGLDAEGDAVCDGLAHGWRRRGDDDVCEQHSDGGGS